MEKTAEVFLNGEWHALEIIRYDAADYYFFTFENDVAKVFGMRILVEIGALKKTISPDLFAVRSEEFLKLLDEARIPYTVTKRQLTRARGESGYLGSDLVKEREERLKTLDRYRTIRGSLYGHGKG